MEQPKLLTFHEVEARVRLSHSTVYRMMRAGGFPQPIKLGGKSVRWYESEIESWLASRPRAVGLKAA